MKYSKYNLTLKHKDRYFVYNTFTTTLSEVPEKNYKQIVLGKKYKKDNNQKFLAENDILIDDKFDELNYIKKSYQENKEYSEKLIITIVTTLKCNFKCPYCYEDKDSQISLDDLSINAITNFIQNQLSIRKYKFILLTWFGGEPLLMVEKISKLNENILKLCKKHSIKLISFMSSNGYLINNENISLLKKLNLQNMYISIDGDQEYHDSTRILKSNKPTFDTIINNLKILQSNNIPYTIRINITKKNQNSVNSLINKFNKLSISPNNIYLGHIQQYTENCHKDNNFYLSKREFSKIECDFTCRTCGNNYNFFAPKTIFCRAVYKHNYVIAPDLLIYKCENDIGNKSKSVGLIKPDGEYVETNKNSYDEWNPLKNKKCLRCKFLPCCLGGCPYTGLEGKQENCFSKKYYFKDYLKHIIIHNENFF